MATRDPALRAFVLSVAAGVISAVVALAAPLHASGSDTVPGRYGAASFACAGTLDLREVDWLEAADRAGHVPYYVARAEGGAVVSVFGPLPAILGAPFMESLSPGDVVTDLELERRARHGAALALAAAATLLCAALCAAAPPEIAALLALVASLSFAGAATLGQGLWQQTVFLVPFMGAVATVAWSSWRRGAALAATPGLLAAAALARPNTAILVLTVGVTWLLAVRKAPARRAVLAAAVALAVLLPLPQLAWNASATGDPLALRAYVASHSDERAVFGAGPAWILSGLAGLLASPARGLLWFAPVVLVAVGIGLAHGDRSARVLASGILAHVGLVAAYRQWWGGWALGPRMLAETVWLAPLLLAPLPPGRARRWAVGLAAGWTVAVGLLGTFRYQLGAWDLRRDPDTHHEALWDARDSPLAAMVRGPPVPTIDAPRGPYAYCAGRTLQTLRPTPKTTPPTPPPSRAPAPPE